MAKKIKNPVANYIISSVMLLGFSLLFSLLSLVFMVDKIPNWGKFIAALVFMAPTFFVAFAQGKGQGELLYREHAKNSLSNIHSGEGVEIPVYKCIYHVVGFAAPLIILILLAFIIKNQILQTIGALFVFPFCLLFMSVNVINLTSVTIFPVVIFIPAVLLICGAFILGYLLRVQKLKEQQSDIESEIRNFNN